MSIASFALWAGKWLLNFAANRADNETKRLEIQAGVDIEEIKGKVALAGFASSVVQTGMQFKAFWIPWLIATVPLSMWFGWGMLDSLANGALPDVAELPPQLLRYADVAWSNLFYAGGVMGGVQALGKAIARR